MVVSSGIKQLPSITAAALIFVIVGAYVLMIADPPDVLEICGKILCPSKVRIFDKFDCSDWLAENNDGRSNNTSSISPWNGIFREVLLSATHGADGYLSELSVQTANINYFSDIINNIKIKLRI